jgi:hypothetical protein
MKFLQESADIPHDLIRSVSDGEVVFLCGAGVSFGSGLPTFKTLTDRVYSDIGEDRNHEPAETIAYDKEEYDRVLRSRRGRARWCRHGLCLFRRLGFLRGLLDLSYGPFLSCLFPRLLDRSLLRFLGFLRHSRPHVPLRIEADNGMPHSLKLQ